MSVLQLLPIGSIEDSLLESLRAGLAGQFNVRAEIFTAWRDAAFAFHAERQQHHSTEILVRMQALSLPAGGADRAAQRPWRLLGVTSADLYIPILTFVFGEALLEGTCAVVSTFRLRQEFYGLPANAILLGERLLKEAVHELGHTLGLAHCEDYRCVMAPSHAVEWIDLKENLFCSACRAQPALSNRGAGAATF